MRKNPGRKERRNQEFKGKNKVSHGKPNNLIAIGPIKPSVVVNHSLLTNKRKNMLKRHPERMLAIEKVIIEREKQGENYNG